MDAQSALDCADYVERVMRVMFKIGVTELALDAFEVDARGLAPSQVLSTHEVVNEFGHWFALLVDLVGYV